MRSFRFFLILVAITMMGVRYGYSSEDHHEESPSGASFKAGKGVMLTDETKEILGVEIADVIEEKLPQVIRFNIQVFGEKHHFETEDIDHSGCEIHGSGLLPPDEAAPIQEKQAVKLQTSSGEVLDGFVVAVKKGIAFDEIEIIVGITSAGAKLKDGEFLTATITLPSDEVAAVIPRSALLNSSQGLFVYVVNGDAYIRTPVKVGSKSDDKVTIADGLFDGDQVVTKPVETLWLIELRATKGGGHSH